MKHFFSAALCAMTFAYAGAQTQTGTSTIDKSGTGKPLTPKEKKAMMNKEWFEEVFRNVSPKRTSIVTLKDGTTYRGYCKDLDRKKGQIYEIEIKDSVTEKKMTFPAEKIAEMYLYPSGFEKFTKMSNHFTKSSRWGNKNVSSITNKGYIYFKNQTVSLKNKKEKREFLMQLINPDFNSRIEVYADPIAAETGGVSFGGGPQIGGGVIKSYYIHKGDDVFWLHKSDFDEYYDKLFGDSAEFMAAYPKKDVDWKNFSYLVLEYTRIVSESGN